MAAKAKERRSTLLTAILQALFVTFLWSTSWVLIKIGLNDIPPLTFAGLRYTAAFLILLPILLRSSGCRAVTALSAPAWRQLLFLGVVYYGITHGAQFISIAYLPAITANLVLGFTPVVVALLSIAWLKERPLRLQWVGMIVSVAGILLYFYPVDLRTGALFGLAAAVVGMMANALSSVLGRSVNRTRVLSPLLVTTISMGIGAFLLLASGIALTGWPALSWTNWAIVGWLALVNTALAFTLWNHTLRTLSALESTLINNTMSVQIPILAFLFLGERLTVRQLAGLAIAIVGVFVVQLARVNTNGADV